MSKIEIYAVWFYLAMHSVEPFLCVTHFNGAILRQLWRDDEPASHIHRDTGRLKKGCFNT